MKPTVVIHTNDKQMLGALVSAHSYRRNSRTPDAFEVRIVNASEFPELQERGHTLAARRARARVGPGRPPVVHAGKVRDPGAARL